MSEKTRISCVSYLNAAPFRYGLMHHEIKEEIILMNDSPAICAKKLMDHEADIGLVPVAAIPGIPKARIISNYCIAADGPVKSVTLLSKVPLHEITEIILDHESMTSVQLAQILAREYWKINPAWKPANPGFESGIKNTAAGVVIGDRSLALRDEFEFIFDLAAEWKKYTGLPFVFACWVATNNPDDNFLNQFEEALSLGVDNIHDVTQDSKQAAYLTGNISYRLDENKRKAMEMFFSLLRG